MTFPTLNCSFAVTYSFLETVMGDNNWPGFHQVFCKKNCFRIVSRIVLLCKSLCMCPTNSINFYLSFFSKKKMCNV